MLTQKSNTIHNFIIEGLTVAAKGRLPSVNNIKQIIRRVRKRDSPRVPVAPLNLWELEIPQNVIDYEVENGQMENFLLCDTGPGIDRILIFGRQRGLMVCYQNVYLFFYFCSMCFLALSRH